MKIPRLKYSRISAFQVDDRLTLIILGIIVGIFSGLASVALNKSLFILSDLLSPYRRQLWAFVLPGAGAALSAVFLDKVVNESAGHGVPEVIYSVSRRSGLIRFRSSISRIISSCLTIGSGGSAGPEAPIVMSGSSIGSNIARIFKLPGRHRVVLVGCGAASAISSIFNAPITGIIFGLEVILGEWSAMYIIPIGVASVAGTEISRVFQGNQIPFTHSVFHLGGLDILASVGLALGASACSVFLARFIRGVNGVSEKVRAPVWARAALGGCLVGAIGIGMPVVLGEGYHVTSEAIAGRFTAGLAIVALALLLKIVSTGLTLGTGGSGGIFAPCLVVGSFWGLTYHHMLEVLWPSVNWAPEGSFALLGMAGLIAGILQAPLTGIFLIVELTGGYEVILPLILVSSLATSVCYRIEPESFYLKDLQEHGELLRPGTDARILADLRVTELLEKDCITVKESMPLAQFVEVVSKSRRDHFPVEDEKTGRFLGMVNLNDVRPYLFNKDLYNAVLVYEIMDPNPLTVSPDDSLADIMEIMDTANVFSLPVVAHNRFLGMISKGTILNQYRKELIVQTSE